MAVDSVQAAGNVDQTVMVELVCFSVYLFGTTLHSEFHLVVGESPFVIEEY